MKYKHFYFIIILMYKVIVFDLDDTLLMQDKTISKFTFNILKELKEKGFILVINTARGLFATKEYIDLIKPNFSILNGGSLIIDTNYNIVYENKIEFNIFKEIYEYVSSNTLRLTLETSKGQYTNQESRVGVFDAKLLVSLKDLTDISIYKIVLETRNKEDLIQMCQRLNISYTQYFNGYWYRINNLKVTKLIGLLKLLSYINLSSEDCIAFGDDIGDLEMLNGVGRGVVVDNADDKVKSQVKYQCKSNEQNGVAKYLKEYYNL